MNRQINRSRGKGSRRLPGRDGRGRKSPTRAHWKTHVPSAVSLESDLQQPTSEVRFRLWSSELPAKLAKLDDALSGSSVPFHIKSLGRSAVVMGLIRTARFRLTVS